ncbi:MAG: alpha/beta hydrolase-fold protein [Bacteroidota bacterium]
MKLYLLSLLLLLFSSLQAQLTVIIDSWPANIPAQDDIHIAGNFQNWDAGSEDHRLTYSVAEDRYAIFLSNQSGPIQFKFTRGSWPTVEGDAQGNFVPNRSHTTQPGDTLFLQIAGWEDLDGGTSNQSTAADNVSVLSTNFPMTTLNRSRRVWLYLPPDYSTSGRSYPVLYMHDGQNVFDATTSFSGEWQVDETLNQLFAAGDHGIIVIAVDNGGSERINEYTPWPHPTYGGGDGTDYVDFLVNDLKPYIDNNYRTKPDRDNTAIMGSSLGGLISAYAALSHPDVFGKVGALSPAYWINRQELTDFVSNTSNPLPLRLHQIIGTPEGDDFVQDMYDFQNNLVAIGFEGESIRSLQHADGAHSEWYWAREFGEVYQWLFPAIVNSNTLIDPQELHYRHSPNPAQNKLVIAFQLERPTQTQISLNDSLGRSFLLLGHQKLPAGEQRLDLNLKSFGLPKGQYWVHLRLDDRLLVQSLIVQ